MTELKMDTVRRALNGLGIRMSTVLKLAAAFKVDHTEILWCDGQPDVAPVGQNDQDIVENTNREQGIMHRALAEANLYQLTDHIVGQLQADPVLGRGSLVEGDNGRCYPFVCYPLKGNRWEPLDADTHCILGAVEVREAENDFVAVPEAEQYWLAMEKITNAVNRRTFRLSGVRRRNGLLQLDAVLGWYRDSILSEVMLERELLLAIGKRSAKVARDQYAGFLDELSFRAATMARLESPSQLLQGTTVRSAALAVSVLVVCLDVQGHWVTPIRIRSDNGVSSHPRMFHTVPSGMLQPTAGDIGQQWDLRDFLYREFAEEVFNVKLDDAASLRYHSFPPIQLLRQLLDETKQATLYLSGFGYSVWSLRPEILLLLLIKTPDWYSIHYKGNVPARWRGYGFEKHCIEFNEEFLAVPGPRNYPSFVTLSRKGAWLAPEQLARSFGEGLRSADITPVDSNPLHPAHWVPPGAAAFWMGLKALRTLVKPDGSVINAKALGRKK